MTNIFTAFREFNQTHPKAKFADFSAPPLFAETLEQRKAAMVRLREAYPDCFPEPTLSTSPHSGPSAETDALAEKFRTTPIEPSAYLIRKYGIGPRQPDGPDGRPSPPPAESDR